jgi:Arc/MetJ family transcription regulator
MRTNIVLNDELMREAMRFSRSRSKTALVEEALNLFVVVKAREQQLSSYADRVRKLQQTLAAKKFRDSGIEILKHDRERV